MKQALFLSILISLTACKNEVASFSVNATEASIESSMTAIDGMADEQANAAFSLQQKRPQNKYELMADLFLENAYAFTCTRAVAASCNSGVKKAIYSGCSPAALPNVNLSGTTTLTYSQATCTLASNGDNVTRTYSVAINGPRGGTVNLSSASHTDYKSNTYGGGGVISKTAPGYSIDILGKHKTFTYNGKTIFDISMRTSSPIAVTGGLSRAARILNGGTIEVNHNLAGITTSYSLSNVQYSNTCCYPVSGSAALTFTGAKTGTATVTFNSTCGSATITDGSTTTNFNFTYCE